MILIVFRWPKSLYYNVNSLLGGVPYFSFLFLTFHLPCSSFPRGRIRGGLRWPTFARNFVDIIVARCFYFFSNFFYHGGMCHFYQVVVLFHTLPHPRKPTIFLHNLSSQQIGGHSWVHFSLDMKQPSGHTKSMLSIGRLATHNWTFSSQPCLLPQSRCS